MGDRRPDGSLKGKGFLGPLRRPDGSVSTEISVGLPINGQEMDVPTLVPSLNKEEIDYLLNSNLDPKSIPQSIIRKAADNAEQRVNLGLSPFADSGSDINMLPTVPPKNAAGVVGLLMRLFAQ